MDYGRHKPLMWKIAAGLAILIAVTPPAWSSPSYNCAKAATPVEKFICTHEDIARLDVDLGELYAARRAIADPQGQQILGADQKKWLASRDQECPAPDRGTSRGAMPDDVEESCLRRFYQQRISELTDVHPVSASPGDQRRVVSQGSGLPRKNEEPFEIVYSTDDELCSALKNLYQKLPARSAIKSQIDDAYPKLFEQAGLHKQAPFIDHDHHAYFVNAPAIDQFYKARFLSNGPTQLIYFRDQFVGHHGLFFTNVWILKPSAKGVWKNRDEKIENDFTASVDGFAPNEVESAIFIGIPPP